MPADHQARARRFIWTVLTCAIGVVAATNISAQEPHSVAGAISAARVLARARGPTDEITDSIVFRRDHVRWDLTRAHCTIDDNKTRFELLAIPYPKGDSVRVDVRIIERRSFSPEWPGEMRPTSMSPWNMRYVGGKWVKTSVADGGYSSGT